MASTPFRIITVCTGNICRSPMAEYQLREAFNNAAAGDSGTQPLDVVIDSAGISDEEAGRGMDSRAADQLRSLGINPAGHVAREWQPEWFAERDLILAMDTNHYRALMRWAPDDRSRAKIHMFRSFDPQLAGEDPSEQGIYDPWYGNRRDFVVCGDMIASAIPGLVTYVTAQIPARPRD